jgi:hypothetical protein
MALQPISESGAVWSRSGYVREPPKRPLSVGGSYQVAATLLAESPRRPISDAGVRSDLGGFSRVEADRALSSAVVAYAGDSFLSLLNLRVLSQALSAYAPSTIVRSGAARPLSPSYLLFVPQPPAPPVDTSVPVVGNFNPTPGTPIARTGPISFEVTDDSGDFRRIFVVAFFPATGVTEVVHDGDGFRGHYAAGSSRSMIAGGFRYTLLRTSGWPGAPTIQTFAIDRAGNEAS